MENIIKEDQDKIMGAVGSEVVQDFLQKYKVENCYLLTPKEFNSCIILVKLQKLVMYDMTFLYFPMSHLYFTGFPHRSDL